MTWPVVGLAALAVAAGACGGGSSASTPPTTRSPSSSTPPGDRPGAVGTVAAVSASSIEVQNPTSGQVTVSFTPTTTFRQTVSGSAADLAPGVCVAANGGQGTPANPGQPFTARSVVITQPGDNGCTPQAGVFGGGNGPRAGNGNGTGNRNGNRMGRFAGAFGKVASVSSPTFVVQGTNRNGANITTTVTTDSSTTFSKMVSAGQSALAVGQCVTAVGPADQTGAVTASSIAIRPAGPNGCFVGRATPGQGGGIGGPPSTT